VNNVVLPIAGKMLSAEQTKDVSGEGYLTAVILHEISHGLGPAYAQIDSKQVAINEAIGPAYSGLEEGQGRRDRNLSGQVAGRAKAASWPRVERHLRVVRGGNLSHAALRHGRGARSRGADGVQRPAGAEGDLAGAGRQFTIGYAAMPAAIAALGQATSALRSEGDRAGVEAWFAKYDVMPQSLSRRSNPLATFPSTFLQCLRSPARPAHEKSFASLCGTALRVARFDGSRSCLAR